MMEPEEFDALTPDEKCDYLSEWLMDHPRAELFKNNAFKDQFYMVGYRLTIDAEDIDNNPSGCCFLMLLGLQ